MIRAEKNLLKLLDNLISNDEDFVFIDLKNKRFIKTTGKLLDFNNKKDTLSLIHSLVNSGYLIYSESPVMPYCKFTSKAFHRKEIALLEIRNVFFGKFFFGFISGMLSTVLSVILLRILGM